MYSSTPQSINHGRKCDRAARREILPHSPEGRIGRVLFDVMVHDNEHMLNAARELRDRRRRHNQVISAKHDSLRRRQIMADQRTYGPYCSAGQIFRSFSEYYPGRRLSDGGPSALTAG
jgi:hypothetical protein